MKKTLVIGASENPERYSYKAITELVQKNHEVVAIGLKEGTVASVHFGPEKEAFDDIDTVSLYVGPRHQPDYYEYIISLKPKRVVFNPGTENESFIQMLEDKGIQTEVACTLVLLATNQY